jgi:hypothetical protein
MNKICLYTISDFKNKCIDCIELLLKSIKKDINYDFFIISNNKQKSIYPVIVDTNNLSEYIGYLKYSSLIPKNYEYYIYLDSDILYFDSILSMIDYNKSFTVVKEPSLIDKNEWYYFQYLQDSKDQQILQNCQALNAGSFAFKRNMSNIIDTIYALYKKHNTNDIPHDVKLEQSIFNYVLYKQSDFTLENCKDITDIVQLFASDVEPSDNKKLYHFCGFSNEMASKYNRMKNFYDQYQKSNY